LRKRKQKEEFELKPVWATANEIVYELNTMSLRDFSDAATPASSRPSSTRLTPDTI
jgi:hypothetical protein